MFHLVLWSSLDVWVDNTLFIVYSVKVTSLLNGVEYQMKILGYLGDSPVFITDSEGFSIRDFAFNHCFSLGPKLVLRGDSLNFVYWFVYVPRARDVIEQWDDGRMEPFASLSDEDCEALLKIVDSGVDPEERDREVKRVLELNTFMCFGNGS